MARPTDRWIENSSSARSPRTSATRPSSIDRGCPSRPDGRLAVLACMDARLTVEDVLGLRSGDAHIIRNAGGLATDDAIRSLVISQQLLGTEEVIVIEHTGCGMLTFQDDAVHARSPSDRARRRPAASTPSPTSRRTCASRSPGSGPIRGSRTCRSTGWSTRSRPDGLGRGLTGRDRSKCRAASGRGHWRT